MTTMFRDENARAKMEAAYERFRELVPDAESRTVETRFGKTHVLVVGPEDAPPLVVLHGALATSAHVLSELGPLRERYRVYAPDVIGQSVKSADRRLDLDGAEYAEWLTAVLEALEIRRADLLGVSWGGFVACKLARHAPDRVDRLVLLVPAGFTSGPIWRGITEVAIPMALYRAFPSEARLARLVRAIFTPPYGAWAEYFGEAIRSYKLDMRVPPLLDNGALASFARPVLVVGASDDLSFPGESLLARAKELLPQAELELLEDCRHAPPADDAFRLRLADRITRFLTEQHAASSEVSASLTSTAAAEARP